MSDADQLRAHAERIRASGVLSRSQLLQRLFDYLIECSLAGRTPKEIEVAVDVFGKSSRFDVSQDAAVRVYIHKLRRKLDEFYSGRSDAERIVIPKGSYRLLLQSADPAPAVASEAPGKVRRPWLTAALAVSIVLNAVLLVVAAFYFREPAADAMAEVRASPVWSRMFADQRPILIVLGDYYIFGEMNEQLDVERLVREFSINSRQDLERYLKRNPEVEGRYIDLGLGYLPISAGFALR
ncbi:MAG TPA: helix-turn-helix domain-containing protein, partial [Steroidobacteraceae bacterium]